ncbi:MAG TPA: sigma-70 family RNA polymerase sigma factor [Bryobacteraceae bacterium]|nr:sigma-70 family RNA polymerase sigma factor [Bryobacteraceae bacterium]
MSLFLLILATYAPPNEAELAADLRRRDPKALATFYDAYGVIIYRFILRMVKDPYLAEDIVQDTFQRLWTRSGQIREGTASIGPWLFTIARNIALDYLRSPYGSHSRNVSIESASFCATESDTEKDLFTKELGHQIQQAFSKLNDRQKQMIELAFYEGLSQSQIAEKLELPLGSVKTWTRGALQALRRSMEKQGAS